MCANLNTLSPDESPCIAYLSTMFGFCCDILGTPIPCLIWPLKCKRRVPVHYIFYFDARCTQLFWTGNLIFGLGHHVSIGFFCSVNVLHFRHSKHIKLFPIVPNKFKFLGLKHQLFCPTVTGQTISKWFLTFVQCSLQKQYSFARPKYWFFCMNFSMTIWLLSSVYRQLMFPIPWTHRLSSIKQFLLLPWWWQSK